MVKSGNMSAPHRMASPARRTAARICRGGGSRVSVVPFPLLSVVYCCNLLLLLV
jgi:hypothetical protein